MVALPDQNEKTRPGWHQAGLDSDRAIVSNDTKFDRLAEDHRLLIGAVIAAPAPVRDRLFGMLQPGDLDTPLAADALEVLRALHSDGVTDHGDLVDQFAQTITARRRGSDRPGYLSWVRYPVGPIHWLASAFSDAAHLGEHGAVVLGLQYSGTGRRRAVADAAGRLADAARSGEADHDDLVSLVDKLLPLLDEYRAVVG